MASKFLFPTSTNLHKHKPSFQKPNGTKMTFNQHHMWSWWMSQKIPQKLIFKKINTPDDVTPSRCMTSFTMHITSSDIIHVMWCYVPSFKSLFLFYFLENFQKKINFFSKQFFSLFNITSLQMWSDVMKCLVIGTNLFKILTN